MKDQNITSVIFRKFKTGEIIALFPYEYEGNGAVNSYMHIGQHGAADYPDLIKITTPVKEADYKDLFNELESIGYNLKVIKRSNRSKMYKTN
jgi:hypothetical protein